MTQTYQPVVLVDTTNLSRDEWLAYRRYGIGGSDAAAVLGISPWRTARDLYFDKLGVAEMVEDEDNWVQLEIGNLLEPLVARIFEKKTGLKVFKRKAMFRHPRYPWMLADLDYLVELPDGSTAILEIKTTNYNARDNWWYNGEEIVPVYYEAQGRHYMAVMNIDRVYFCCLYGNREDEAIIRHIDRDEAYEEELITLEGAFWQDNVLARTPPPYVEGGELIMESLRRRLGPSDKDAPPVEFAMPQYQLIQRYLELQQEKGRWDTDIKQIEAELSRVKAQIIAAMGASSSAVYDTGDGGYRVTYNPVRKAGITKDMLAFIGNQPIMLMLKLDGLTVKLTYDHGELQQAATRGNGDEGEVITHNAPAIFGVPRKIPHQERLVVVGEAFIRPSDFERLRGPLLDSSGEPYKNGRNLAAGSVRLLDPAVCKGRSVTFMAFNVLEGLDDIDVHSGKLMILSVYGFPVCPHFVSKSAITQADLESAIQQLRDFAKSSDIPIDGIVAKYDDSAYGKAQGRTGHHYKDGLAFKFEDDLFETKMRCVEWNPSRTGEITPVAIFDKVEIDGCSVSRASLHNLSFMEELELMPGNRILVSKRNMIIPHVEDNLDRGGFDLQRLVPKSCPCCGMPTRVQVSGENNTKTLFCDNPACPTRYLRQFVHFTGEKAMNIEGLSEGKLEKLLGWGFLHSFTDIYRLDAYKPEIVTMDGFGEKSWQNLWDAIQRSRETTFERYLCAMDIPMVGSTASRALAKRFHSSLDEFEAAIMDNFDFSSLPDFGATLSGNIHDWFQVEEHWYLWVELREWVHISPPEAAQDAPTAAGNPFAGKTIVVTGKAEPYTRGEMNAFIESLGAIAGSSVTGKTNYLVCGEKAGSKLDKARSLGITVLTPEEFFSMVQEQGGAA